MSTQEFGLEDLLIAVYCALDDAIAEAGIKCEDGKLIPRRGPAPELDDREVLCLAIVQELLGFDSDNSFFEWAVNNKTIRDCFPRLISRQKFAERRALLTPLIQQLCKAFCALGGEDHPPFRSSIPTRCMSARPCAPGRKSVSTAWLKLATAPL
ncbi:MAG: hypothetical protein N3A38_14760 [Planctomycetota bacterium]|nr:hypothetical protein [Planctomycetota bacterium]